ncbi:MAG TPA: gluconate 2-dehydrogenase subunit 3 family protein [Magnetospirillaceae bacterium]|nr:gluconate 2-dehydrogenase subunit 3 family protein [Magnetospirillaceae bacterium]
MSDAIQRRRFLIGAGGATLAAAVPPAALAAETPPPVPAPAPQSAAPDAAADSFQILTAGEIAFLGAAADTMIPADDLSPSASECGVVVYIDRQLAGAYGAGARIYTAGPFQPAQPGLGWQSPVTPLGFFRAAIAEADRWCKATYGHSLDRLSEADRIAVLKAMEKGEAAFKGIASKLFFTELLQLVMEGFFGDPIYGGNRNKASWRMIGYPGLPATYREKIEAYRGKRYEQDPQSIADFS